MASEWFMRKNGEEDGPFSSEQIKQMVRNGLLAAEDLIWKEGMDDWRPAGESRRLFPQSGRRSSQGSSRRSSRKSSSRSRSSEPPAAAAAGRQPSAKLALLRDKRVLIPLAGGGMAALLLLVVAGVMLMRPAAEPMSAEQPAIAAAGARPSADPPESTQVQQPADAAALPAVVAGPPPAAFTLPAGFTKRADYTIPRVSGSSAGVDVSALALAADNRHLAVGLADGRLLLYDTIDGGPPRRTERAHPGGDRSSPLTDATTSISFSPSGKRVAWGTMFRHFAIVDLADGAIAWRSPVMAKGLRADLDPPQVVLKDDDTLLVATASGIGELSTIDICRPLNGGTPWQGMGLDAVVGDAQLTFVAKSGQGIAGRGPGRWPVRTTGVSRLVAISPDGTVGGLFVADPAGSSLALFELGGDVVGTFTKDLPAARGQVARLMIPARDLAVLALESQLLMISGTAIGQSADLGPASPPTALAVDADRRRGLVCRADHSLCVIALNTDEKEVKASVVARIQQDSTASARAAISPDGTRFAIAQAESIALIEIDAKGGDRRVVAVPE